MHRRFKRTLGVTSGSHPRIQHFSGRPLCRLGSLRSAMARPLRINLAGGWYHVTARGNERRVIYRDDEDRDHFLNLVAEMVELFQLHVHAYVLMPNHYHLLLELPEEIGRAHV